MKNALERCDALTKFAWVLNTSVAAALMRTPYELLALFIVTGAAIFFSQIPFRRIFRYWRILTVVPCLLFAFHLFLHPGTLLYRWGPFEITREGVWDASVYSLRLLCSVVAVVIFLATTEIKDLVTALIAVGVPVEFSFAVYLMLRFVPMMASEAQIVQMALSVRAPRRHSLRVQIIVALRYLFALVFLGVRRADQTALAMDVRGFSEARRRTFLRPFSWNAKLASFLILNMCIGWGIAIFPRWVKIATLWLLLVS